MEQILIDKATCPANAKMEFIKRMNMSRDFIRKQPGLVKEDAYESTDKDGNLTVLTTVIWENEEALQKTRQAVMAEYKREGFNMMEFCQRLGIKIERGDYKLMVYKQDSKQSLNKQSKTDKNLEQILIDKVTCPANAKMEFIKRGNISRDLIRKQPGLIKEEAYESTDKDGDLTVITTVIWENEEALQNARQAITAEYKREGFNMLEFCQRSGIKIERGEYKLMIHE
jgi:heme-degrading monooxygenase HmoA